MKITRSSLRYICSSKFVGSLIPFTPELIHYNFMLIKNTSKNNIKTFLDYILEFLPSISGHKFTGIRQMDSNRQSRWRTHVHMYTYSFINKGNTLLKPCTYKYSLHIFHLLGRGNGKPRAVNSKPKKPKHIKIARYIIKSDFYM